MALLLKTGVFNTPTSNGDFSVGSLGFGGETGKLLLLWCTYQAAVGSADNAVVSRGMAISSSERRADVWGSDDANATAEIYAGMLSTKCLTVIDPIDGSIDIEADFVSWDSDGFTLNFSTVQGTAFQVHYVILGGSDISAKLLSIQAKTTAGTQGYTGAGFQPTAIIPWASRKRATSDEIAAARANANVRIGFGTSSSAQGYCCGCSEDTPTTMDTRRVEATNKVTGILDQASDAILQEAGLTSLDSDGFTLDWTTVDGAADYYYVLCIGGLNAKAGNVLPDDGTANQAVTGVGFQPSIVFFAGWNASTTMGVVTTSNVCQQGFGRSSSERANFWAFDEDAGGNANAVRASSTTRCVAVRSSAGTTIQDLDFVSHDSDGFTLDIVTNDNLDRTFLYLALGVVPSTSEEPKQPNTLDEQPPPGPWSAANYQPTFAPDLPAPEPQYAQAVVDEMYRVGPWSAANYQPTFEPLYLLASMQGEDAVFPDILFVPEYRQQPDYTEEPLFTIEAAEFLYTEAPTELPIFPEIRVIQTEPEEPLFTPAAAPTIFVDSTFDMPVFPEIRSPETNPQDQPLLTPLVFVDSTFDLPVSLPTPTTPAPFAEPPLFAPTYPDVNAVLPPDFLLRQFPRPQAEEWQVGPLFQLAVAGLPDVNAVLPPDFLFVQARDLNRGWIAQPELIPAPAGGVPADDSVYFQIENPEPAPLVVIVGETGVNLPKPTIEVIQVKGGSGISLDQVELLLYPSIFAPPFFAPAVVDAPKDFFVGELPIFLPPRIPMQSVFEERDTVEVHEPVNFLPTQKQLFQPESEFRPPDIFVFEPPPEPPVVVPPAPVDCADPPDPGTPHPKPAPAPGTSIDDAKPAPESGHPIGCA